MEANNQNPQCKKKVSGQSLKAITEELAKKSLARLDKTNIFAHE